MRPTAKLIYDFCPFRLNTAERILLRNGRQVPLMPKPYENLLVQVEHCGHIVTKEELMRRIRPDVFVQEVNLFKHKQNSVCSYENSTVGGGSWDLTCGALGAKTKMLCVLECIRRLKTKK